jgi:hypothetical protein
MQVLRRRRRASACGPVGFPWDEPAMEAFIDRLIPLAGSAASPGQ